MEMWKTIEGFEGKYEVSDMGRVRRIERWVINDFGNEEKLPDKIVPSHYSGGREGARYLSVGLIKDNVTEKHYVHRLVAKAFIPNKKNKKAVNHIDCNKENNDVKNLEWVTYKENYYHAIENGINILGNLKIIL